MATEGSDVWIDLRDRLRAFLCYAETLRNICGWIAGVHGYLDATDDAERSRRRSQVYDTCARELDNARNLLLLWERSDVDFMPLMAHGETTHHYGMNLGELLRHRIDLWNATVTANRPSSPTTCGVCRPGRRSRNTTTGDF